MRDDLLRPILHHLHAAVDAQTDLSMALMYLEGELGTFCLFCGEHLAPGAGVESLFGPPAHRECADRDYEQALGRMRLPRSAAIRIGRVLRSIGNRLS